MPGKERQLGPKEEPFAQQQIRHAFLVVKSFSGDTPDGSEEAQAFVTVMTRLLAEEQKARFRPQPQQSSKRGLLQRVFHLKDPELERQRREAAAQIEHERIKQQAEDYIAQHRVTEKLSLPSSLHWAVSQAPSNDAVTYKPKGNGFSFVGNGNSAVEIQFKNKRTGIRAQLPALVGVEECLRLLIFKTDIHSKGINNQYDEIVDDKIIIFDDEGNSKVVILTNVTNGQKHFLECRVSPVQKGFSMTEVEPNSSTNIFTAPPKK